MEEFRILGGTRLRGKVLIQGSKNASLPILAATLLTEDASYLRNCPKIADVYKMIEIMESLGCGVKFDEHGVKVTPHRTEDADLAGEAVSGMRSSLCLLGALLGRDKRVIMEHPGGCVIGERPIDLHIRALTKMGVVFTEKEGRICADAKQITGADIVLPFPSVGATENIILAAVLARGDTVIRGASREPEVRALCEYLSACGAEIKGIGTGTVSICGVKRLRGCEFCIPADRIVAGTYLLATVGAGGSVLLQEAPYMDMDVVIRLAIKMGAEITGHSQGLYISQKVRPKELPYIFTAPFPGVPTDLQSIFLVVRCVGTGECMIEERIFENRFRVVEPLLQMGADIKKIDVRRIVVTGVNRLEGKRVEAKELRGGAALVTAGLLAHGETVVCGTNYINRGYENICRDLRELGARIVSV